MVQYPIEDTWLLHFELVTLADYRWFVYYYIIYENVHVVTQIIIVILFSLRSRVDAENRPIPRHLAARSTLR